MSCKGRRVHRGDSVPATEKIGLEVTALAKSRWVLRKLRNSRAGVDAGISFLGRTCLARQR